MTPRPHHPTAPRILQVGSFVTALWALHPIGIQADVLLTTEGRLTGRVAIRNGELLIDDRKIPYAQVMSIIQTIPRQAISDPHKLRLRSGEVWSCRLLNFARHELTLRNSLIPSISLPETDLLSVDFAANLGDLTGVQAGMLYRRDGDPIGGRMIWFDDRELSLESPLGLMQIGRAEALRFVVSQPAATVETRPDDILGLIDGSIYRGQASLSGNGIHLTHARAGEIDIPWVSVQFLQRQPPGSAWLAQPAQNRVIDAGMDIPPPPPYTLDFRQGPPAAQGTLQWLQAHRMHPGTAIRFTLPEGTAQFRTYAIPLAGARSAATLVIWAGEQRVFEQTVALNAAPMEIKVAPPAGARDIVVRVLPAANPAIPAGIDICDTFITVNLTNTAPVPSPAKN